MKQTQSFNAEIKQLLDIVVHSLYSNKEIFLRELISNASDAIDKLKFQSLTQADLAPFTQNPHIRLEPNTSQRTLTIIDSGIGMNRDEVVEFIGTIAKSGTKAFAQLQESKNRPELIGQFGVGFYSAFMVADKVTLHTQKAGTNMGVLWESTGDGTYSIDEVPRALGHGTSITLHLKETPKEDESFKDFSDEWTLRSLVKKYSDFIAWPILMKVESTQKSEDGKTETKEFKDETLNSMKALWLKSPSEVKDEEYKEFYQHLTHDWMPPAKQVHYRAEGTREFNVLFYIPSKKPWNYQTKEYEYGLNLYIKRVFIMENCKDLLPAWLRFVKGLVDSSDLSLNVSREILQQDREVAQIRKNVVAKVLSTLKDWMSKERTAYETFFQEFGTTLKEGIPMDGSQYKEKIAELLLARSTNLEKLTSLDEYVERMKAEQKDIYYIIGERLEAIQSSAYLEKLQEKGFEVLLLTDVVDEWLMRDLTEYKGKKFQSITKEGLDLDTEEEKNRKEEEKKSFTERFKPLMEQMKSWLGQDVSDVVISDRLTKTAVCLVNSQHGMSAHMEKILSQMGDGAGKSKRILEINPKHAIFDMMMTANDQQKQTWTEILYNQALITEGSPLPDPVKFSNLISDLMVKQKN
jgi:molecular chaperone HtpG